MTLRTGLLVTISSRTFSRRTLLTAALAAPLGLAACGQSAGSREGVIRIVTPDFPGTPGRVALEGEILSTWDNTAVRTTVDYIAWDKLNEKLTTGIASGIIPDMIMMGVGWVPPFAEKGVFDSVPDDLFTEFGINESLRPTATYEGRLHGLPYMTELRMFAYNRAIFDELGIRDAPATLEEFRELGKELQGADVLPFDLFSNNVRQTWLHFVSAMGGSYFTEDGLDTGFTDGSGAAALQFMMDLIADGSANFNVRASPGQPRPWQLGQVAVDLVSTGNWPTFAEQTPDRITEEAMGMFLMPGDGAHDPVLFMGGTLISLSTETQNDEALMDLLRHMFQPDMLLSAGKMNGKMPPVDNLPPDPEFDANRIGTFALENLDYAGAFEGGSPAWMEVREQVAPQLEAAVTGQQSVQDTMDYLERVFNVALDRIR